MNQEKPSLLAQRLRIAAGVFGGVAGLWAVYMVRGILAPFILAFVLAYVLTPLVDRLEGRGMQRTWSILLIFAVTFSALVLGLVTLGKTLTEEMVDLSIEFLRQESVQATVVLTNTADESIAVTTAWVPPSASRVFSLVEPDEGSFDLPPGADVELVIRYAPPAIERHYATLLLRRGEAVPEARINLRGNWPDPKAGTEQYRYWVGGGTEDAVQWEGVVLGRSGIDFGTAGPNVLTSISQVAQEYEPYVKPYLGEETDLPLLIKKYGSQLTNVLLGRTTEVVGGVVSGLMLVVIVPFVAFFFLKEGRRITHGVIELVPNAYFELILNLLHQINGQIGGYIRGQILAVTLVASLSVLGLSILGMPYFLPVGVLAGLANMIPYLGPLIGIVSATIVALATLGGMGLVMKVVILFLIIQIIDNVIIQPMVVAKSVDLHPLVVLVVVMIGSDLMGMAGMLIAVPLTGILKVSGQTVFEGLKSYNIQ